MKVPYHLRRVLFKTKSSLLLGTLQLQPRVNNKGMQTQYKTPTGPGALQLLPKPQFYIPDRPR